MSTTYPSDLTGTELACVQRYLPAFSRRGGPAATPLCRILDANFHVLRIGCTWRYFPTGVPPWRAVFCQFRRFRLNGAWRHLDLSAAAMDSQGVRTVEESARIRGYDGHNRVKVRKRHPLVSSLGVPMPAISGLHICQAPRGLSTFSGIWRRQQGDGWQLEIVEREPGIRGFAVQPHQWLVELPFAWLSQHRRLAKDYERKVQTSKALIEVAVMRALLARFGRDPMVSPAGSSTVTPV
jgi:putative transposase